MGENTKIEWCDHTFNPWRGCTKVAAGCANCYAESQAKRVPNTFGKWGPNGTRVVAAESAWKQVERWDTIAKITSPAGVNNLNTSVFCGSMCDVFEDWAGDVIDSHGNSIYLTRDGAFDRKYSDKDGHREIVGMEHVRNRVFNLIDATRLTWLLLTKRPENIRRFWTTNRDLGGYTEGRHPLPARLENAWCGTSIACRALCAGTFWSLEPLIEDLGDISSQLRHVQQVIVGGESGPNARPMMTNWVRGIYANAYGANVPFFFKQWGEWIPQTQMSEARRVKSAGKPSQILNEGGFLERVDRIGKHEAGRLLDGVEHNELPEVKR